MGLVEFDRRLTDATPLGLSSHQPLVRLNVVILLRLTLQCTGSMHRQVWEGREVQEHGIGSATLGHDWDCGSRE